METQESLNAQEAALISAQAAQARILPLQKREHIKSKAKDFVLKECKPRIKGTANSGGKTCTVIKYARLYDPQEVKDCFADHVQCLLKEDGFSVDFKLSETRIDEIEDDPIGTAVSCLEFIISW